jgi:hypothetical protein
MDEQQGFIIDDDFNLGDDYKPSPLIPNGNYYANVIEVSLGDYMIKFKLALEGNDGVMSDGETPLDGQHETFIIWLPKPEDGEIYTSSGKQTKRQWKLNNMAETFAALGLEVNTPADITQAIEEQAWLGLNVIIKVGVGSYKGKPRNEINSIAAVTE